MRRSVALDLRIDESLYFANARFLEDCVYDRVAADPSLHHVVLMCSAVNEIDGSALESLEAINARLSELGVRFHLSEVKGPVMDRLRRSHFLDVLSGEVFLSQHQAFLALSGDGSLRRSGPETRPLRAPDASVAQGLLAAGPVGAGQVASDRVGRLQT